jgi:hypothetical protein
MQSRNQASDTANVLPVAVISLIFYAHHDHWSSDRTMASVLRLWQSPRSHQRE